MTYQFGDAEPEDAWHPDDPLWTLIDNVGRRCAILGEPRFVPIDATAHQAIAELAERLHRLILRRDQLDDRTRHRVDLIAQDVAFLQTRLDASHG